MCAKATFIHQILLAKNLHQNFFYNKLCINNVTDYFVAKITITIILLTITSFYHFNACLDSSLFLLHLWGVGEN